MKVIKEGTWNIPWFKEITCTTCAATLLIDEKDVKPTTNQSRSYYCVCPICQKQTFVEEKLISQRVREEVDRKRTYYSSSEL
ncbi:MAG: hypothetical protein UU48_C0003G0012 [Candidatus Uhrbacteria bacterium GW2011_GWF2_41_16]|uniref:Uncharacterized protein n=2 Tax=Candidatus Uhriibacteriota TaxID=1752732 RepID=A0A0G0VFB2_9BACT|nr:MAG: hypothetical protein UU35_C0003G0012 [Candidatus Uhrbacteria bacterium GW2011_GWC2_41_11]KKR98341.1 MAG: hypothetical protein UU48_C0003G0012 [Candidatus Uhrbacteria bacterium GW2011_GWF2_41_16]HBP00064.1 hypothetical protein [Candidatus Uhrbacteria bacterium]